MPAITTTGDKTSATAGLEFLRHNDGKEVKTYLFSGTTLPTTLKFQIANDAGTAVDLPNGTITALPETVRIGGIVGELILAVTGGSPNFNVTLLGIDRSAS